MSRRQRVDAADPLGRDDEYSKAGSSRAHARRPISFARRLASIPRRQLLAFGAAAFLTKLGCSYLLYSFAHSRCFLIDWSAGTALTEVPRVHDQAELDVHIARHEPALLEDALAAWPAVAEGPRRWTPARLASLLGEREVELFFWGPSASPTSSGASWKRSRSFDATFSHYVDLLRRYEDEQQGGGGAPNGSLGSAAGGARAAPYLQEDEELFADHEETLLPDVLGLPYAPHAAGSVGVGMRTETAFWVGPRGAWTGIHWDSVNALLHQLHGSKRVVLWPPSARGALYPSSKYNHGAELSQVDAAAPDHARWPRYGGARSLTLELREGSALFVPAGWWHAVQSLDTSVSLALRSQTACQARASLPDDALLWLHDRGWYKRGNCVCHHGHEPAGSEVDELAAGDGHRADVALRAPPLGAANRGSQRGASD